MNLMPERLRDRAQHTLGEPQVAGPLVVYPVFDPARPRLAYRTFAQAVELGAFAREREGAAAVRALVAENATELPLLLDSDGCEVGIGVAVTTSRPGWRRVNLGGCR